MAKATRKHVLISDPTHTSASSAPSTWRIENLRPDVAQAIGRAVRSGHLTLVNMASILERRESVTELSGDDIEECIQNAERLKAEWEANQPPSVVYYVRVAHSIKIGVTVNLKSRLTSYPPFAELLATEPGDMSVEKSRHHQFSRFRIKGEWFNAEPELMDFIATL